MENATVVHLNDKYKLRNTQTGRDVGKAARAFRERAQEIGFLKLSYCCRKLKCNVNELFNLGLSKLFSKKNLLTYFKFISF